MNEPSALYRDVLEEIWPQVDKEIFAIEKPYTQLNFPEDGGVTGYFSRNCTKKDLEVVKRICDKEKIDVLNTRVFKYGENHLKIMVGSVLTFGAKN